MHSLEPLRTTLRPVCAGKKNFTERKTTFTQHSIIIVCYRLFLCFLMEGFLRQQISRGLTASVAISFFGKSSMSLSRESRLLPAGTSSVPPLILMHSAVLSVLYSRRRRRRRGRVQQYRSRVSVSDTSLPSLFSVQPEPTTMVARPERSGVLFELNIHVDQ